MKRKRLFLPTIADLIDALAIDQIKEVKLRKQKSSFSREILKICNDIDIELTEKKSIKLNSRLIRIVIILAQLNLHIWNLKNKMQQKPENYNKYLKLAHQLNGLRNKMKNLLLEEFEYTESSLRKTNTETDNLRGWNLSVEDN